MVLIEISFFPYFLVVLCVCGADKVFGPATTTRRVYDVAAQHVVNGAMQGINGKQQVWKYAAFARE